MGIYEIIRDFWALAATALVLMLLAAPKTRGSFLRAFFVTADAEDGSARKAAEAQIEALRAEIAALTKRVEEPVNSEVSESIRKSLDTQLYSHVPEIIAKHLERLSKDEDALVRHFESAAREAAHQHLKGLSFSDLIESAVYREAWEMRRDKVEAFSETLDRQLASANGTRMVMMNLFVLFNLLLLGFMVTSRTQFSEGAGYTVLGVYVSLSAFIIYIYRASNARAAALLSIKEDDKKLYDVFLFLTRFKKGNTFSNNEVEIIKNLLINRFEREKGADHPYEVILKGITNSTVLLRGGKVIGGKRRGDET